MNLAQILQKLLSILEIDEKDFISEVKSKINLSESTIKDMLSGYRKNTLTIKQGVELSDYFVEKINLLKFDKLELKKRISSFAGYNFEKISKVTIDRMFGEIFEKFSSNRNNLKIPSSNKKENNETNKLNEDIYRKRVGIMEGKEDFSNKSYRYKKFQSKEIFNIYSLVNNRNATVYNCDSFTKCHFSNFLNPLSYGYYGRKEIFDKLHIFIKDNSKSVICIHGFAGEGKTSLIYHFITQIAKEQYYGAKYVFYWCFKLRNSNVSDFFETVLSFFDKDRMNINTSNDNERAEKLIHFLNLNKCILILDNIETLQHHENTEDGDIYDKSIKTLITNMGRNGFSHGGCIIAISHKCINELRYFPITTENIEIPQIGALESLEIFKEYELKGTKEELIDVAKEKKFHPLTLILFARIIHKQYAGDIKFKNSINLIKGFESEQYLHSYILNNLEDLFYYYDNLWAENSDERIILLLLSIFRGSAEKKELIYLIESCDFCKSIASKRLFEHISTFNLLKQYGLVIDYEDCIDTHTLIREHYYDIFKTHYPEEFVFCNKVLANYYLRDFDDDSIEYLSDMEPLYNAVYFFTQARDYKMALKIFWDRICRGREFFSQKILGAYSKDYFVISQFFDTKKDWQPYVSDISETDIAWLYSVAAYLLNNFGLLSESEKLRKLDIEMHKKLGNSILVASDSENLARNLTLQSKFDEAIESLEYAASILNNFEISEKNKENNSYSKTLSILKLKTGILTRMAFIYFCMGKNYYEKANQVLSQIYTQYNYNSTDAFYIYIVKLSCIECKQELVDFKKTITKFYESSLSRKKSYEISYGYLLLALVNFKLCLDAEKILDFLENAIKYSKESGRVDINLIMQFAYIHILMEYSSDLNNNNRDDYIKKIGEMLDKIEFTLSIYYMDLFHIELLFKKIQYLVLIEKKEFANQYWLRLRNNPICRKYYLNRLNEILK